MTTLTHTDSYLPADNAPTMITNPQAITNIMEADAEHELHAQVDTSPKGMPHVPGWDDAAQQEPSGHLQEKTASAMLDAFVALIVPRIERMVETKFAQLVENKAVLAHIDEALEARMRGIAVEAIEDAINDHVREEQHFGEDDLADAAMSAVENHRDIVTRSEVREMVSDAIDAHESDSTHLDRDDVEEIANESVDNALDSLTFKLGKQ